LELGHFPLVLDPVIKNVRFKKVLIDGGSALDILFCNALIKLGLKSGDLKPYDASFWGVLLGQTSRPLGQITLPVQFGTPDHFRVDYINFIVADFEGTYHAILSRPALAKFMAVPHYVYLLLKMPTKKGVITLRGNVFITYTCEKESFTTARALELSIRLQESIADSKKITPEELEIPSKEATHATAKSKETKEVELVEGDKTKTARIGANLDPK
jgi:hypothetical protein